MGDSRADLCYAWCSIFAARDPASTGQRVAITPRFYDHPRGVGIGVSLRAGSERFQMKTTLTELGKTKSGSPSSAGAATPPIWKLVIPRFQLAASERQLMLVLRDALA